MSGAEMTVFLGGEFMVTLWGGHYRTQESSSQPFGQRTADTGTSQNRLSH